MDERINELHKELDTISSSNELNETWLTSLTQAFNVGGISQTRSIPDIMPNQLFSVTEPPLRYIEFKGTLIISFENNLHKFPASMAPYFKLISSKQGTFTMPEVISLQQKSTVISTNEIIHYMKALYRVGIINRV